MVAKEAYVVKRSLLGFGKHSVHLEMFRVLVAVRGWENFPRGDTSKEAVGNVWGDYGQEAPLRCCQKQQRKSTFGELHHGQLLVVAF